MLDFLREEGVSGALVAEVEDFRRTRAVAPQAAHRVPEPRYLYYGRDVWEAALAALLCGENLLLVGPKATGKNVLAECLTAAFGRPGWDISFYVNTDAATLIGTDTFADGAVTFREGPVTQCARLGGFGILDEINMARNESLAVLHAALDFRRCIDVPGYDRIRLDDATRFIATMNYGYAGTWELNGALASRFVILDMPLLSAEHLKKLLLREFPHLRERAADQFAELFLELERKCAGSEISTKALDLRGLLAAIRLMDKGLPADRAVELGITNKAFSDFERQVVADVIQARLPRKLERGRVFAD